MFDKLRNAFSSVTKTFSEKELKETDIDDVLFQLEIALMESDVATEVIDSIKNDLKGKLVGSTVDKNEIADFVRKNLIQSVSNLFDNAGTVDIISKISQKKESSEPFIILFVGINGTGKTTTLAKLAHLLKENKISIVIAAADTFRAGAIEQLREHANRLNLKIIAQNYGADPAAVARDSVLYAKSHKIDCILIDTAGRMQTSKNLMDQIEKITKVVNPDFKIFVGDSLAGNDTVNQAREFFQHVNFDGAILTKSDADARGGAALSVVTVTAKPILYVGVGQEYTDLQKFDKNTFLQTVFGDVPKPELKEQPKPELKEQPKPELKEQPKPELKEQPKPELKEQPKP
ncbi:MAG TPA: signal recognition particle-docking protein FtsY, partial [Candidatus Nitrosotenuis sp.]|nr:signal recognition particle-docking protein FtsY [Candidatus Nitrosotenuis sp.]